RENITNAALTMSGGNIFEGSGDLLPDLFSNSSIFNAGNYRSVGYMASVTQAAGENLNVSAMYGSGDALLARGHATALESPDDLRSMIRRGRRRFVTTQVSGQLASTHTQFSAGYQWTDRYAASPTHFYATQRMRAEAGLNVYIRQPIPTLGILPVRIEASADLRNLLAQGYLPFTAGDGRTVFLMNAPRSFRGGLSFIF
ncbi:MAG: hypothetical protein ABIZ80_03790, partial [Bryobacteraceae bacterium]